MKRPEFNYVTGIDAEKPNWLAVLGVHLDKGEQVFAYNLKPEQERDCKAIAQEHDLDCIVEDRGEYLKELKVSYPDLRPEILGFVHRDVSQRRRKES